MIFLIIVDNTRSSSNNNVLVSEKNIEEGVSSIINNSRGDSLLSSHYKDYANEIKEEVSNIIKNNNLYKFISVSQNKFKILVGNDDDCSIPYADSVLYVAVNGEPYGFFGSYISFTFGVYWEDCLKIKECGYSTPLDTSECTPLFVNDFKNEKSEKLHIEICYIRRIFY